jgi:hypothetical protein
MNVIKPSEWGLTLAQFRRWVSENNVCVERVVHIDYKPVDREEEFYITKNEDLIAFKLTFKLAGKLKQYLGKTPHESAIYYCPYDPDTI